MTWFSSYFAIIWQKMKKNTSWKFTDELSVTFQSSVSGAGEFGQRLKSDAKKKINSGFNHCRMQIFQFLSIGFGEKISKSKG